MEVLDRFVESFDVLPWPHSPSTAVLNSCQEIHSSCCSIISTNPREILVLESFPIATTSGASHAVADVSGQAWRPPITFRRHRDLRVKQMGNQIFKTINPIELLRLQRFLCQQKSFSIKLSFFENIAKLIDLCYWPSLLRSKVFQDVWCVLLRESCFGITELTTVNP